MADIELVIKISEEDYESIKDDVKKFLSMPSHKVPVLYEAVNNGTPLPKGHGRLGDLDKIWCKLKELEEYYQAEFLKESNAIYESAMNGRLYGFTNAKFMVQDAPTIIEADKEYEVEVITRGNCMMCGKELVDELFFCKECENKVNGRK